MAQLPGVCHVKHPSFPCDAGHGTRGLVHAKPTFEPCPSPSGGVLRKMYITPELWCSLTLIDSRPVLTADHTPNPFWGLGKCYAVLVSQGPNPSLVYSRQMLFGSATATATVLCSILIALVSTQPSTARTYEVNDFPPDGSRLPRPSQLPPARSKHQ